MFWAFLLEASEEIAALREECRTCLQILVTLIVLAWVHVCEYEGPKATRWRLAPGHQRVKILVLAKCHSAARADLSL